MTEFAFPSVDSRFLPRAFFVEFPKIELIEYVEHELTERARLDPDQCYGFFPDNHSVGIDHNLPACNFFASSHQMMPYGNDLFYFSWLRLSLARHEPMHGAFHLDGNSQSGLGVQLHEPQRTPGFRALINLGNTMRKLRYSTQLSDTALQEVTEAGHTACYPLEETIYEWEIPPRRDALASGVIFCATHVMHTGDSSEGGHFLASYGRDEVVTDV